MVYAVSSQLYCVARLAHNLQRRVRAADRSDVWAADRADVWAADRAGVWAADRADIWAADRADGPGGRVGGGPGGRILKDAFVAEKNTPSRRANPCILVRLWTQNSYSSMFLVPEIVKNR